MSLKTLLPGAFGGRKKSRSIIWIQKRKSLTKRTDRTNIIFLCLTVSYCESITNALNPSFLYRYYNITPRSASLTRAGEKCARVASQVARARQLKPLGITSQSVDGYSVFRSSNATFVSNACDVQIRGTNKDYNSRLTSIFFFTNLFRVSISNTLH